MGLSVSTGVKRGSCTGIGFLRLLVCAVVEYVLFMDIKCSYLSVDSSRFHYDKESLFYIST